MNFRYYSWSFTGANCNALFIRENLPVDMDMLRYIACGVLSALDFLHRNNVVHKELRDSCIFIDNNGTSDFLYHTL